MPLAARSFCFLKGDVGGERGFDAALAFLASVAPLSDPGDSINTNITKHNTTPTTTVSGFVRFSDRTGPMAELCCWVSSTQLPFYPESACVVEIAHPKRRIFSRDKSI